MRELWGRMRVLGRDKLVGFYTKHANAKSALDAWISEAECAAWQTPQDIKTVIKALIFWLITE